MTDRDFDPLFGDPPPEIPLANAPLACVVAQAKFAPILRIRSEDYVAPFQEQIRSQYPTVEREKIHLFMPIGGDNEAPTEVIWRFVDTSGQWRVSLTPTFVALESRAYTSRTDFMGRFKSIVAALKITVGSARVTRVGVRYVDHLRQPEIDGMSEMLRSEMLGMASTALRAQMLHTVSEMFCNVAEGSLLARWGLLPPNGTHDPNVMSPTATSSWFLDLDVFKQYREPFEEMDADAIHTTAFALAARSYALFRWAATDRFLEVYGARR